MSGPTHQKEMAERRAMLGNDQKLRDGDREPATFHSLANLDTGLEGRFAKADYVAGQDPSVNYPRLPTNSPWSGDGPQPGLEPSLGYSVNDLIPCGEVFELQASLSAAGASADAGNGAECAPAPTAVETSAPNSLISSASAADQASKGVQAAHNTIVRGSLHPTLTRPGRRL